MLQHMHTRGLTLLVAFLLLWHNSRAQQPDPIPAHDSLQIASQIMGETRRINIWLPPQYAQSQASFPVLYMPDGGLGEDFVDQYVR